jgi:hypothetical protein
VGTCFFTGSSERAQICIPNALRGLSLPSGIPSPSLAESQPPPLPEWQEVSGQTVKAHSEALFGFENTARNHVETDHRGHCPIQAGVLTQQGVARIQLIMIHIGARKHARPVAIQRRAKCSRDIVVGVAYPCRFLTRTKRAAML